MPTLVFHAKNANYVPENVPNMVKTLQQIGFIGGQWKNPDAVSGERYLIGDSFLSLITFMGCAPAIEIEPIAEEPESTEFCHIEIEDIKKEINFVRGSDHIISRCPHCRQRHADWKVIPESLLYICDKCNIETHLSEYDWKNTAGCGRFFIHVHGIYPQEALPTSNLLQALEKTTGTDWTYFYIQ